jgi:hypothetical protein
MASINTWDGDAFAASEFEDPGYDPGPPVSIRSLRMAARRRRLLWVSIAFAGLVLGASLHILLPSKVNAVAKVYLVEPTNLDPTIAIANDLNLLETRTVAERAMGILHLNPNMPVITYKATNLGTSILSIKASAASGAAAIAESNAVAQAFLQVRTQVQSELTNATVTSLNSEIQQLQTDVANVQAQMQGLNPGPALTALENQLQNDAQQIGSLKAQVRQANASEKLVSGRSAILDQAYVVVTSKKKTMVKDGLSGLVAGLALGLGIVITAELLSDRPRRRADVAAALGAPVDLSVGRFQ